MAALALGIGLVAAMPAWALDVTVPSPGAMAPAGAVDLQALQNRLHRQIYQQQQQNEREQDRQVRPVQPPAEVQRIQPGCTGTTYAAGTIQACR